MAHTLLPSHYRRFLLNERTMDKPISPNTYRAETVPFDSKPGPGQALVKVNYLSLDPGMVIWIRESRFTYTPPVPLGSVARASGLGTVIQAGEGSTFKPGDLVSGILGITEYAVLDDALLTKHELIPGAKPLDFLGPLGATCGLTAYFGIFEVAQVKPGETLVVSGAAGAVGSLACQFGKKAGCKVVGIAGTDAKCDYLKNELGIDVALNYKSPTFHDDFDRDVGFWDAYFDNVGGDITDFLTTRMNRFARVALCENSSSYSGILKNIMEFVVRSGRIQGFIVFDYVDKFDAAIKQISGWLEDGSLKSKYHIVDGLERLPEAFSLLFSGGNTGKL
ncbi:alcohol dehydrogenase [Dentipellis sp. KUC8613]|nr:alcohol dehydrogenase [Dentipellis sp. KUC8613]